MKIAHEDLSVRGPGVLLDVQPRPGFHGVSWYRPPAGPLGPAITEFLTLLETDIGEPRGAVLLDVPDTAPEGFEPLRTLAFTSMSILSPPFRSE